MDRNELLGVINNAYAALQGGNAYNAQHILQHAREACQVDVVLLKDVAPLLTDELVNKVQKMHLTFVEQVYINGMYVDLDIVDNDGNDITPDELTDNYEWSDSVGDQLSADELFPLQQHPQWVMAAIFGNNPSQVIIDAIETGNIELSFVTNVERFVDALKKGNIRDINMFEYINIETTESNDT